MSDHKALLKHSGNYLMANLATKALGFISIPVYTRLLTVEEYGIIGVFMSMVGMLSVFLTLDSEVAISRYYYDAEDEEDFKKFVGTTVNLTTLIALVTVSLFIMSSTHIAAILSFPIKLVICFLPVCFSSVIVGIFTQIYTPLLQSKKIAAVSSIHVYLGFGLSVVFILLLSCDKYFGYVWGSVLASLLLGIYIVKQIKKYYIFSFKTKHIKYILNYCIPYIPYTLSGIFLGQFSRVFIGNNQGFALAGSYSLTTNVAALMLIVIGVTHSAWNPYYFQYMTKKTYSNVDNDYNLIWRVTLFLSFVLAALGYELALLLSHGEEYMATMVVLPVLVLGYVAYQWAYVYLRNTGFAKRNIWNAYCVIVSGIINVCVNSVLVPIYREIGAAIATLSGYVSLLILAYLTNRFVIKEYVPFSSLFTIPFLVALPFFVALEWLYIIHLNLIVTMIIKVLMALCVGIILLYPYRREFLIVLCNLKMVVWKRGR